MVSAAIGADIVYADYGNDIIIAPDLITDFQTGIDEIDPRALRFSATDKLAICRAAA